jgi:SAM-dependent methyltransferase
MAPSVRPAAPTGTSLYDVYRSHFKGEPHPIEPRLMRERYGRLLERSLEPGIDLGAGSGEFIEWLAREGIANVRGVDISPEQVAAASRLGRDVRLGDIEETLAAAASGSFASIFMRDVLEHLERSSLAKVAAEAARTLRPGGTLFVQVPNGYAARSGPVWAGDLTHVTLFSEDSLAQLLSAYGFELVDAWGITPGRLTAARLLRSAAWIVVRFAYILLDLIEAGRRVKVYERVLCAEFRKR